ncbi:MAG: hypothetical protein M3Q69_02300 [Acidobacteriota bacterium]|nr:hypothetical protein [Acidobacteriota bacterium]
MSGVVVGETLRRHFTNVGYIAYLLVMAMVALATAQFGQPAAAWPTLVALLAIISGSAVIGPEFSTGTLQLVLVKPINRAVYLVSRVTGVVLAVWVVTFESFLFEAAARMVRGEVPWAQLGTALVNTLTDVVMIVALLALLGSLTRAYFNVAIYVGAQMFFGLLIALGQRKWPEWLLKAVVTVERNLFPDAPPRIDRNWLLLVWCNAAIALVLACLAFRRREVPYGAD